MFGDGIAVVCIEERSRQHSSRGLSDWECAGRVEDDAYSGIGKESACAFVDPIGVIELAAGAE